MIMLPWSDDRTMKYYIATYHPMILQEGHVIFYARATVERHNLKRAHQTYNHMQREQWPWPTLLMDRKPPKKLYVIDWQDLTEP